VLNGASIPITSQFLASAMLLLTVGNYDVGDWGGLQSRDVLPVVTIGYLVLKLERDTHTHTQYGFFV